MKNYGKYIITDVDGVMLNWENAFQCWMEHQGHNRVNLSQFIYSAGEQYGLSKAEGQRMVALFNQSAAIGFLPPLRDAQEIIRLLHQKYGYRFVVCTSLSVDKYAQDLRTKNLVKLFGDCFEEFVYLPTGADKDSALLDLATRYPAGSYWVEDKYENMIAGNNVGFTGVLMEHGYNMKQHNEQDIVVTDWEELFLMITKNERLQA